MITGTSAYVPATLGQVLEETKRIFEKVAGLRIPFQCGPEFAENFNTGSPPCILYIPDIPGGHIDAGTQMGVPASWVHRCEARVREKPGHTDFTRMDPAYNLAGKLVAALRIAGSGRIQFGDVHQANVLKKDAAGVTIAFSFTFTRNIDNWEDIWAYHGPIEQNLKAVTNPLRLRPYDPAAAPSLDAPESAISVATEVTITPKD